MLGVRTCKTPEAHNKLYARSLTISNMREVILNFPKQFKEGLEAAKGVKVKGKFSKIIVCGMGGSALPSNILLTYLPDLKPPLYIHRNYGLPSGADKKSLIIAVSYSGNTEETISAYEEAVEKGFKTIAISCGGKLKELAEKKNLPQVIIPSTGIQPRCATGYLFSALLKTLSNSGVIEDKSEEVLEMAENLNPLNFEAQGKNLAKKLTDKIPIIYASNSFKSLARIWKIKFNENSKIMAFWNYFPELNHNEMAGITNLKGNFHILIIRDKDDQPRISKRMELFADLAKEKGVEVDFIELEGKNILEKIFNNLILSDWVSYYLAQEYKVDPVSLEIIEEFKKKLKE